VNDLNIEVFNFDTGQWERREVKEAEDVLAEIDKMQAIEKIGLDYKHALIDVINTVIDMKIENIYPMRN
tara:strand:+ start:6075 stop:6281 length:207 start_codon:yes stop_codon:yes gene_type:complete